MKKTQKTKLGKFERLFEAVQDDELFGDEDVVDTYEDEIDSIEGDEEFGDDEAEVTLTIDRATAQTLLDIIQAAVGGEEEGEEEDEFGGEDELDEFGGEDFGEDELEQEAVEFENAPDAETVRKGTKSGKVAKQKANGELFDKETSKQDGEEKQYKFVKREKPTELKYKTTKGS